MSTKAAPGRKRLDGGSSSWYYTFFSPSPPWTPAPDAVHLTEADDDFSPTSSFASPSNVFSFASPRQSKPQSFFPSLGHTQSQQHGHLEVRGTLRRSYKIFAGVLVTLFWVWGGWSFSYLQERSRDPISVMPPHNSPSGETKAKFTKLYKRDWGAEPPLWVALQASTTNIENLEGLHSLTDTTSVAYEGAKHFCYDMAKHLEENFQRNGTPSVRITSYYHLQEAGLDYFARHLVTPNGSKTIVKIEYIKHEMGENGVRTLKKSILEFAKQNQPSNVDFHYTGQTWNGSCRNEITYLFPFLGFIIGLAGLFLKDTNGVWRPFPEWGVIIAVSMATTISASSIFLNLVTSNSAPMTPYTLVLLSFVLSVFYSKLLLKSGDNYTTGSRTMVTRSGGVLIAMCGSIFFCAPSSTLQSVSAGASAAIASSVCFHACFVPHLLGYWESARNPIYTTTPKHPKSRLPSLLVLCVISPIFLFVVYRTRRLNMSLTEVMLLDPPPGGAANRHFDLIGESMGHGLLTPYRILFDGHKRNHSMVSLMGYDVVQMVVDELSGISLSETGDSQAIENSSDLNSGSTHVGESVTEVQQLIEDLFHYMKRLREDQQRIFDHQLQHRQEHWEQRQEQEVGDFDDYQRNYNVNKITTFSGIAVLENRRIPHSLYSAANTCRERIPRCPSEALHLLNVLEDETTTSDHLAVFVTVNLQVDPFSKDGKKWLHLARETIRRLQTDPRILGGIEVHIGGLAAEYHDSRNEQTAKIRQQLAFVAGVTTLALAIFSDSVFLPLRILATLGTTMAGSLGAGVLIYNAGVLKWTLLLLLGLLATSMLLVFEISLSRHDHRFSVKECSSPVDSTKLVAVCLALLSCVPVTSNECQLRWPVLVLVALFVDMFWIWRFILPCLAICPHLRTKPKGQKQGLLRCMTQDNSEQERTTEAFLANFIIRSCRHKDP